MKTVKTAIDGCYLVEPPIFKDDRGYFMVLFNHNEFHQQIPEAQPFVIDNQSKSIKGTIRGLHLQTGKHSQAKLLRVVHGQILDVVVDVRKDSPTYLNKYQAILDGEASTQIFVPRGCLHGFSVLSEEAVVHYKCDNFYYPKAEAGVLYNDQQLDIDWNLGDIEPVISEKDKHQLSLQEFISKHL